MEFVETFVRSGSPVCTARMIVCINHQNFLQIFAFFTQKKYGPQTIVHEHTPSCLTHWKVSNLLIRFPDLVHTFWIMWSLMYFSSSLLKFYRWISSTFWRWCQSFSWSPFAASAGFSEITLSGFPTRTWRTLALISIWVR